MKCFRRASVCGSVHMRSVCSLSCQVGVDSFPATIKALCGWQSLPCADEKRGARYTGEVFILSALLWGLLSVNGGFISHCEASLSFQRMSTDLRYELEIKAGKEVGFKWQSFFFFPLSTAKWSHLARVAQISTQLGLEFGQIEKFVSGIHRLQHCDI